MKTRWPFLAIVGFMGVLYVVGQFWHPSLIDTIVVLFIILSWMISYFGRQVSDRLDLIEAELRKKSEAPGSELRDQVDGGFEEARESASKLQDAILKEVTE